MTIERMLNMMRISLMKNGFQRAEYLKKKNIFASMGKNCFWQPRNIPPEAKLIKLHDNVVIASEVLFVNHDVIHHMAKHVRLGNYSIQYGAIEIGNNVFIGSRSIILPGTYIEDDVIIGAGSLVTGKIISGGVYAGVPARRIGDFNVFLRKRVLEETDNRSREEKFSDAWDVFYQKYKAGAD